MITKNSELLLKQYNCNIYSSGCDLPIKLVGKSIKDVDNIVKYVNKELNVKIKLEKRVDITNGSFYNPFSSYEKCMSEQLDLLIKYINKGKVYIK